MTRLLARGFVARGHQVRVVGIYPRTSDLPLGSYDDDGIRVWRLRETAVPKIGWMLSRVKLYRQVRAWSRRGEIDLVEVPDYQGWAARWPSLSVPVIVRLNGSSTYNSTQTGGRVSRRSRRIEKASLARRDFWCSASRHTALGTRKAFGIHEEPDAILYNFVEMPARPPGGVRDGTLVTFAGTLNENKGILRLLRAWRIVHGEFPAAQLHVYGKDGRMSDGTPVRNAIREELPNPSELNVVFHGHVDREEILQELGRSAVAVFPSLVEAFSHAPVEAMAAGCPTVFTNRASGPELITDGVDGLLVDPTDPASIARAILQILGDDDLASRLGSAGRRTVEERFSSAVMIPQNEAFFAGCLERFRQGAR